MNSKKVMHTDDDCYYFKKPGSIPFKWEIRPGVPKIHDPSPPSGNTHFDSTIGIRKPQLYIKHLKPPPAGSHPRPHPEARLGQSQSPTSLVSRRFGLLARAQPDIVSATGCFPGSPLVKRKNEKMRSRGPRSKPEPEYCSDNDIPYRWSVSSRKSNATASPLSPSLASYQSSAQPARVSDAEWARFGLF